MPIAMLRCTGLRRRSLEGQLKWPGSCPFAFRLGDVVSHKLVAAFGLG
jgi:hypothetical protein